MPQTLTSHLRVNTTTFVMTKLEHRGGNPAPRRPLPSPSALAKGEDNVIIAFRRSAENKNNPAEYMCKPNESHHVLHHADFRYMYMYCPTSNTPNTKSQTRNPNFQMLSKKSENAKIRRSKNPKNPQNPQNPKIRKSRELL